jgi:hypothetical protein
VNADDPVRSELRRGVGESLTIYQAVVAMVSLFTGFVFVGLLQLLTASDPLDAWRIAIVWLLTIALIALTTALLCFHTTAHCVVRYWRIFYPVSTFNRVAALAFDIGLLAMYLSLAVLMFSRHLRLAATVTALSGFGLAAFDLISIRLHGKADYLIRVDNPPPVTAEHPDPPIPVP